MATPMKPDRIPTGILLCVSIVVCLSLVSLPAGASDVTPSEPTVETSVSSFEPSGAVFASEPTPLAATTSTDDGPIVDVDIRLRRLPDQPGTFEAELRFVIPDGVHELQFSLEPDATVRSTSDIERPEWSDDVWTWTEESRSPSMTFTMPANRTAADSEAYEFVDAGEWALVRVPQLSLSAAPSGSTFETSVVVDGDGVADSHMAFFGPVTEHTRESGAETIRLVVPEAATLRGEPSTILDVLEGASRSLDVGNPNTEVLSIVAPTGDVEWAASGFQLGDSAFYVRDSVGEGSAYNTWVHEYVHTRQSFTRPNGLARDAQWLIEAQADYYPALFALEAKRVDHDQFTYMLSAGTTGPSADAVLTQPDTWTGTYSSKDANYLKGRAVVAELDRTIRAETDGNASFEDVFRSMNRADRQLTNADFLALVEQYGGAAARDRAAELSETSTTPELWDGSEHRDVFGFGGPDVVYESLATDRFGVSGVYREASFDDLPVVVRGETVTVEGTVTNTGNAAGEFDIELAVDGRVVDRQDGTLESGASADVTLSVTDLDPGSSTLEIGDEAYTIVVSEPDMVTVTDLEVTPQRVSVDQPVAITAQVTAEGSIPASETVKITIDGSVVHESRVSVLPGETETVETTVVPEEIGSRNVAVGDRSVVLTVTEPQPTGDETNETIPGFDIAGTLVAFALSLLGIGIGRAVANRSRTCL